MKIETTHPPSAESASRYRSSGYWKSTESAARYQHALTLDSGRIALVDNSSQWTYGQLSAHVITICAGLLRAAVTAGEAVLLVASLRNAAVAGYLATLHCGAVAVLLDRRCGESDIVNACRDARPRLALAFDDDARRLSLDQHCQVLSLDDLSNRREPVSELSDWAIDPDSPAVVLFTSGTTSAPKGVIHTANSLRCASANMIAALSVTTDDVMFLSSPLASITGVLQLESALATRAAVVLDDAFSAASALDRIDRHGATIIGGAPAILEALFAESERQRRATLPLRCVAVGGTMVPPKVLTAAHRFGVEAVRVYGSSEVPFSTATTLSRGTSAVDDGAALPGVELTIRDVGGVDELMVRGPHQFHGYLRRNHNADSFSGDWIRTGDRADIERGRLTIKGRLKEVVVRKGMKISLAEIDSAATGLGDCAAFAVADEATGERLALAIRDGTAADITYAAVVAHLSATGLAKWKLPEQIVQWDGPFPRTASGKIIRQQLADESRHLRTSYAPRLTPS